MGRWAKSWIVMTGPRIRSDQIDPKIKIEILVKISITHDNNNYKNDLTQNNILT